MISNTTESKTGLWNERDETRQGGGKHFSGSERETLKKMLLLFGYG